MTIRSDYGCRMLAWAEGPIEWSDDRRQPDLYGF